MSTDTHIMPDSPEKVKVRIETAFLAIPDAIARDVDLTPGAKLLFGCIYSLSHTPSGCYGSNDALAKRIGLSRRQIQRMLLELEGRKIIKRHLEGSGRDRPEIEVVWRGKVLKPRKRSDKLSNPPSDKLSPTTSASYPPTIRRNGNAQDKLKKSSGPDGPERISSNKSPTPTDPGGPSSGQTQDEPEKLIPWRRLVYGNESVEDVCEVAAAAGYTVGFREEGKLIDLAPTDGRKPTYRDREAMTELGKRIRLAQKAAAEAEALAAGQP